MTMFVLVYYDKSNNDYILQYHGITSGFKLTHLLNMHNSISKVHISFRDNITIHNTLMICNNI